MTDPAPDKISWITNPDARLSAQIKADSSHFSSAETSHVRNFHRTLPNFQPTPLAKLDNLARQLGVTSIRVKDESHRCGLKAFKILGASFALSAHLAQRLNLSPKNLSFTEFQSPEQKQRVKDITCITATDGNHGKAVAWAAQQLGFRAVIFMPRGTTSARLESIRDLGADASIIDGNFDDAVQLAADRARRNRWLLIQDTAWVGYEDIPRQVMQGYLTMFDEAVEQLSPERPSHVFIQCGVGSLAGSLQGYLVEKYGDQRPLLTVVEPTRAACYYQSIKAMDGRPHKVGGDLNTIMAGLACGDPSIISWEILRDYADVFAACPDDVTTKGMRVLGNPLAGDDRVISGESGAVTLGLLINLLKQPKLEPLKKDLNINSDARILLFSTEGDTDPEMYRKIVWGI
ncbi:MAG: diaminopropionate ammonia-lyase [Desulfobacterales bacterium]